MRVSKRNPIDACIHIVNNTPKTSLPLLHILTILTFCAIAFIQIYGLNKTPNSITYVSNNYKTNNSSACQTLYITGIYWRIRKVFVSRGFNIECKHWPDMPWKIQSPTANLMCYEYNRTHFNNNMFCNGGILLHYDCAWLNTFANIKSKTSLQKTLNRYCTKFHKNDNICDFHLLTYNLGITDERHEFLSNHIDCNNNEPQPDKTWVFKENKDKGSGVHILNNHQLIYNLITAKRSENINGCVFNPIRSEEYFIEEEFAFYKKTSDGSGYVIGTHKCLIQEFINNPLLINLKTDTVKHVFHLRTYFMIASYYNPFIVLHFPKFLLYINGNNEYQINQNQGTLDKSKILTNRHITDPQNETTEFNMDYFWGPTELQNYLDVIYGTEHFGGNYATNKLNDDIKHILKHLFKANSYSNELNGRRVFNFEGRNHYHFDMLCADIMITDKFELKLLEINAYCGEHCSKKQIKNKKASDGVYDWDCANRYDEAGEIAMEIYSKKYYNQKIEKIDSLNHYEVAFWE